MYVYVSSCGKGQQVDRSFQLAHRRLIAYLPHNRFIMLHNIWVAQDTTTCLPSLCVQPSPSRGKNMRSANRRSALLLDFKWLPPVCDSAFEM